MNPNGTHGHPGFGSTRWTTVLRARSRSEPEARAALEELCRAYWYPLYAFIRRRGFDADRAADLTQGFFTMLVEKEILQDVDRSRGRFRSYLLACCQHFLANECDREQALKRGGDRFVLSLSTAEGRYLHEPADCMTPEWHFNRRWAIALLENVLQKLRAEYRKSGREALFELLKPTLTGQDEDPVPRATENTPGMSRDAFRQAARRLRLRYREHLRREVAGTIADPALVEEEIRDLFRIVSGASG